LGGYLRHAASPDVLDCLSSDEDDALSVSDSATGCGASNDTLTVPPAGRLGGLGVWTRTRRVSLAESATCAMYRMRPSTGAESGRILNFTQALSPGLSVSVWLVGTGAST